MTKGRAVLFMGARKPFEITEYEVPSPEPVSYTHLTLPTKA